MNNAIPATAIALAAVLWGTWWWPMRLLDDQGLSVAWSSLVLYAVATALLAPAAWARRENLRAGGRLLLAVGGCIGSVLVLWNVAVTIGDVVRVTLLFYLSPVWATLLAWGVLREPVGPLRALSIAAGLSGAAVVLGFPGETGLPLPHGLGDWLGLASGAIFAMALTLARMGHSRDEHGQDVGLGGFEQSFVGFAVAAGGSLVFATLSPLPPPDGADIVSGVPLAALIALVWLLPQTVFLLWGAARFDPGRTAILMLLEVVAAAVSATLLAGDVLDGRDALGCGLILFAGILEAESIRRAPTPPLAES